MVQMLYRAIPHFARSDYSENQIATKFRDMTEDLTAYTLPEVDAALRVCRCDAKCKFYPSSGVLIELIENARKAKREIEAAVKAGRTGKTPWEFGDSRPMSWEYHRKRFWAPHWSADDLNKARDPQRRARYDAWLARVKAGELPQYNPEDY